MFTLEILRKVREGTLRVHEKRDIEAAAPLLKDYLVHGQVETIEGLLEAQLREALKQGPEHARDVYWDAISDIGRTARHKGGDLGEWMLRELSAPRFLPHTKKEAEDRSNENQERYNNQPRLQHLISRHTTSSHFSIAHGIMRHALLSLDTKMATQAATLIAAQYKDELYDEIASTTVKRQGNLYGFNGSTFKLEGHDPQEPLTVPYLKKLLGLTDQLDAVLGLRGTRKEFIKAAFMQALGNDGTAEDAAVKAYILKQADRLPAKDRLDIVLHYSTIHYGGTGKSLCHTLDGRYQRSLAYTHETDVFDRFVETLKKWTAGSKTIDFTKAYFGLKNQYLDHYEWDNLRTKGIYDSDRIKHYAPELRWAEVQRRLEMIRSASNIPGMRPFNFDTDEYLKFATIRAVSYGHAEDLRGIFDYYDSLTPEQKAARRFENGYLRGFPQHDFYGRVSHDPETVRVLTERLPLHFWVTEAPSNDPPLLVQMMAMPDADGNLDSFHHFAASYVSAGKPMTMRDVAASYAVTFPFLERSLPHFSTAQREKIEEQLARERYRQPFSESKRGLLQSEDPEAAGYWVKAIYQVHPPKAARAYVQQAAEGLCSFTHCTHQMGVVVGFFKAIKECDPNPKAWEDILGGFTYNRYELLTAYVAYKLAPETCNLDEDTPPKAFLRRCFAKIPEVRSSMDELVDATKAELGLPTHRYSHHDPHENFKLMNELMPYFKKYGQLEDTENFVEQSRRLSYLFDTFRQVDTFLRRHAQPTRQPIHDLCLFELPERGDWNKPVWGNLVLRYGHPILRLLPHAPGIEAYMRDHIEPLNEERRRINRETFGKTGQAVHDRTLSLETMSPSMIRSIAVRVGYKRGSENPALAHFCINLMAEETAFDETLDLVAGFKDAGKHKDRMPSIVVDGASVGLEGYRMERVPHGDPLSLWIGKIVNCCNYLGGDGADMARAQFKDPNNALYIIRDKRDRPIAKLSGWLSTRGNVVFNAWERKSEQEDFLLVRFTAAAALKILETAPKVQRVMLGAGPLNPHCMPFKFAADPEQAKEGVGRTADSQKQFVLAERDTMGDTYEMLDWEIAAGVQRGEFRIKLRWNELQQLGLDR